MASPNSYSILFLSSAAAVSSRVFLPESNVLYIRSVGLIDKADKGVIDIEHPRHEFRPQVKATAILRIRSRRQCFASLLQLRRRCTLTKVKLWKMSTL
jgi:hypothetical protein